MVTASGTPRAIWEAMMTFTQTHPDAERASSPVQSVSSTELVLARRSLLRVLRGAASTRRTLASNRFCSGCWLAQGKSTGPTLVLQVRILHRPADCNSALDFPGEMDRSSVQPWSDVPHPGTATRERRIKAAHDVPCIGPKMPGSCSRTAGSADLESEEASQEHRVGQPGGRSAQTVRSAQKVWAAFGKPPQGFIE